MLRGVCRNCGDYCMICGDGTSSCCNSDCDEIKDGIIKKETQHTERRKTPSAYAKKNILEKQQNKCYWCGRQFGEYVLRPNGALYLLRPIWDHYMPYWYSGNSRSENFVASCNRCNSHKAWKIVTSEDQEAELREVLKRRWFNGGWKDLF